MKGCLGRRRETVIILSRKRETFPKETLSSGELPDADRMCTRGRLLAWMRVRLVVPSHPWLSSVYAAPATEAYTKQSQGAHLGAPWGVQN